MQCVGGKEEEGEGRKGRRKKRKEKKEKGKKEKRELPARFAAAVGHARCDARPVDDVHTE